MMARQRSAEKELPRLWKIQLRASLQAWVDAFIPLVLGNTLLLLGWGAWRLVGYWILPEESAPWWSRELWLLGDFLFLGQGLSLLLHYLDRRLERGLGGLATVGLALGRSWKPGLVLGLQTGLLARVFFWALALAPALAFPLDWAFLALGFWGLAAGLGFALWYLALGLESLQGLGPLVGKNSYKRAWLLFLDNPFWTWGQVLMTLPLLILSIPAVLVLPGPGAVLLWQVLACRFQLQRYTPEGRIRPGTKAWKALISDLAEEFPQKRLHEWFRPWK